MKQESKGIIYKVLNIFCIVLVGLVNKGAMKDLSTFQTFFLSCLSSLIVVSMIIKFQRKESLTNAVKGINKPFFWIACVNFVSFCTFLHAIKLIDLNIVTGIMYLSPVIVTVLAVLILGEKLSFKIMIALIVSILGTIIIVKPVAMTSVSILGLTCSLTTAIGWALHDLLLKRQATKMHWTRQSFMILILCTPMAFPLAITTWQPLTYTHIKFVVLLGIVYTTNKMLLMKALANTRLLLLAPISYTKLIFISVSTYILFNEIITLNTVMGSTLIIAATILVMYSTRKISSSTPEEADIKTSA